ncbi:MAG TPA: AAA family ATPase [Actinomycetota bacterium]|nr:AAA family ATPase [Actinomycetota bacterium]
MSACPSCRSENAEDARFCSTCGARLVAVAAPVPQVRKIVTIVFCDVVGSTSLAEGMDAETWGQVMVRYFEAMRAALERHGGTIEKFIGDAVMAVFGVPLAREDDALRAVRAAQDMRVALDELNEELDAEFAVRIRARTGIHTGEIVAAAPAAEQALPLGDAANTAARFEQAAGSGEILLGDPTYRLVRHAVRVEPLQPLELKGKADPVAAWRLVEVVPDAPGLVRHPDVPIVGREAEIQELRNAFDLVATERRCQMVTVIGEAGVGKSRLIRRFREEELSGQGRVLQGRCRPYGETVTFGPLAEALLRAAGIEDNDPTDVGRQKLDRLVSGDPDEERIGNLVAAAVGLAPGGASAEEVSWAFRRLLSWMAAGSPLVVVLDDLQWAAPVLLDLVEQVAEEVTDAQLLLLGMARPDLLGERPSWPGRLVRLGGLTPEECLALIGHALGDLPLASEVARSIAEPAGGNPLFLEELVAMLIEDGSLERTDDSWTSTRDLGDIDVPPTIDALLAARLEQLPRDEGMALETASVIGQVFSSNAVAAMADAAARSRLPVALDALVARDIVQTASELFAGDPALRFRHLLIRDAAYRRLPKASRSDLHERFAAWLEGEIGERIVGSEEIIGYHLEQAYLLRTELRPGSEEDRALASRAARRLASAGRRAMDLGDGLAASGLLGRAVALAGLEETTGIGFQLELAMALGSSGDLAGAEMALDAAKVSAQAKDLVGLDARIALEDLRLRMSMRPSGVPAEITRRVPGLIAILEREGDDAGLAAAWNLVADAEITAVTMGSANATLERALGYAERAHDVRQASDIRKWLIGAATWGRTPVRDALKRIGELDASSGGNPLVHATAMSFEGLLFAMLGRFDEGRSSWLQGTELLEELHQTVWAAAGANQGGQIELLAGDLRAAERILHSGFMTLEAMGEQAYLSTVAGLLAKAVFGQGRIDEAEGISRIGELACDEADVQAQALWRQTRARILAVRGDLQTAESLAMEAVRLNESVDDPIAHGEALLDLAEIQRIAGRWREAVTAMRSAVGLFHRKGAVVLEDRARSALAALTG